MLGYQLKQFLYITLILISALGRLAAQSESKHPPVVNAQLPILFAVYPENAPQTKNAKLDITSIAPIAFVDNNKLYECFDWSAQNPVPQQTLVNLRAAYKRGLQYPLYWRGVPFGKIELKGSCIDEQDIKDGGDFSIEGCARRVNNDTEPHLPATFAGIAFTGHTLPASHQPIRTEATKIEKAQFIQYALALYAKRGIQIHVADLKLGTIWKTSLSRNELALVGNVITATTTEKENTYKITRLLAAFEISPNKSKTLLVNFHDEIETGNHTYLKPSDAIELEENEKDEDVFFDNYPLYANEPDIIVSHHTFYEADNFSIYRWNGHMYHEVYSGCGI